MGRLRVMDGSGDYKATWDPGKPEEVEAAKIVFERLIGKKYKAFGVKEKGEKGNQIFAFDPSLSQAILVPPAAGG